MFNEMKKRISGPVILLTVVAASGCQTVSRQQNLACDYVVDPEIPHAAILSPPLEEESETTEAPPIPQFVSVELGDYENVPMPCRPSHAPLIAQVQWRQKQRPAGAEPVKKTTSPSGSEHIASIRTSTETVPAPPPGPIKVIPPPPASSDNCLPMLTEWKQRVDSKSLALESELVDLRQTLMLNQKLIFAMKKSLTQANAKIDSMTTELTYYRKEVGRLEEFMEQQHSEDIVVLDELSKQLGNLLMHTTVPVSAEK